MEKGTILNLIFFNIAYKIGAKIKVYLHDVYRFVNTY